MGGVERGEHNLTVMAVGKICDALEIKVSELFKISDI
jgi:DNA-binding Xre family transcriptional regulator